MILVDSSAWLEYDHGTGSSVHRRLRSLVASGGNEIVVTEPVLMELLAGARSGSYDRVRRMVTSFGWVPVDPVADFEGAAAIYRACRSKGVTPSGLIDCMIANIALRTRSRLLAADTDFARIGSVVPLQLDR